MGYRVKAITTKHRSWKVQFEEFVEGKRVARDIPETELRSLGFLPSMSLIEAKIVRNGLNALEASKRRESRKRACVERVRIDEENLAGWIPELERVAFESEVLFGRFDLPTIRKSKIDSHWRTTRRLLTELKIDIGDWAGSKVRFYDYFSSHSWAPSYCQKITAMLNLWGSFVARRRRCYFEPLPWAKGREATRISDKYFEQHENGLASSPLDPGMLEAKKSVLLPEHYRWLFIALHFGLRPEEVDGVVADKKRYRVTLTKTHTVLEVYQTKLTSLPRPKRWKPVPLLYPEQTVALGYIQGKETVRRPLAKTVRGHFGERFTCYCGRKGFVELMLARGHRLEKIAVWMGHTSVDRTFRDYKDRQRLDDVA